MTNWEYNLDMDKFAGPEEESERPDRGEDDGHNDEPYTAEELAWRQKIYNDRKIRNFGTSQPGAQKI